ncbi:hypothetical protein BKA65DRAFT_600395 [Rhexocercosporidium sp. MPI-PUGE-AT-0058]|nr:hypothetical protein BKA65DRAFT_600395 [Rhexocercosporidium sp. MPI-PUGE-AT-0058]
MTSKKFTKINFRKTSKKLPIKSANKSTKKSPVKRNTSANEPTSMAATNLEDNEVKYEIISINAHALRRSKRTSKKFGGEEDRASVNASTTPSGDASANTSTDVPNVPTEVAKGASFDVSAEVLLQLAAAASKGPVQISGTMLSTLLDNIKGLQGEVGSLQKELGGMKFVLEVAKLDFPDVNDNLQDLQYGSDRRFTLFPKLPLELRTMIWASAFAFEAILFIMLDQWGLGDIEYEGFGVKVLLLIVGTPLTPSDSTDLVLIEPRQSIGTLLSVETIEDLSMMLPLDDNDVGGMS